MLRGVADSIQPGTAAENTKPRVLRSRQMLMEALLRLLSRKEFDSISVQEIADEATLNRATFYLEYPDKDALLQAMTAARFRDLIARRGVSFTNCDGALRAIALGVCDYLAASASCPGQFGPNVPRRLDHPGGGGHVSGRCREARDGTGSRSQTAGDGGGIGHGGAAQTLVPDCGSCPRRGDGCQD